MHKQYYMLLLLSVASILAMDAELPVLTRDEKKTIKIDEEALIKINDGSLFFGVSYWQWNKQNAKFNKVPIQKNSKVQELRFDGEFSQDVIITPDNQTWYCWNPRNPEDKDVFGVSWWKEPQ